MRHRKMRHRKSHNWPREGPKRRIDHVIDVVKILLARVVWCVVTRCWEHSR